MMIDRQLLRNVIRQHLFRLISLLCLTGVDLIKAKKGEGPRRSAGSTHAIGSSIKTCSATCNEVRATRRHQLRLPIFNRRFNQKMSQLLTLMICSAAFLTQTSAFYNGKHFIAPIISTSLTAELFADQSVRVKLRRRLRPDQQDRRRCCGR